MLIGSIILYVVSLFLLLSFPLVLEEIAHLPPFSVLFPHAHGIAYLRPLGI